MSKFSSNLRKLRNLEGLTQKDLATKLNVSNSTISNWEKGVTEPDIGMLKVIAEFFAITVDSLLDDHSIKKEPLDSKEIVRVTKLNDPFDGTFYALNALVIIFLTIGLYVLHSLMLGFLMLSLILLIIYTGVKLLKPLTGKVIEGTLEPHETLIYEQPKKGKEKVLVLSLAKFIVSVLTLIYGTILILESVTDQSEVPIIIGGLFLTLIIIYILLFIFVYPFLMSKKPIPFMKTPNGFNLWVIKLITLVDFLIFLIPSLIFMVYRNSLLDLNFPIQVVPIILIMNYLSAYILRQTYYDYFKAFKLFKQNNNTDMKRPF
jgi:transcriptional regulator with XRE-family HTH domain